MKKQQTKQKKPTQQQQPPDILITNATALYYIPASLHIPVRHPSSTSLLVQRQSRADFYQGCTFAMPRSVALRGLERSRSKHL